MATETAVWFERSGNAVTRQVTVLNATTAEYSYESRCGRCGGAGGSQAWRFTGYKCFDCGGSGRGTIKTVKVYSAEKLAKLNAAADKREAKAAEKLAIQNAKIEAEFNEWKALRFDFVNSLVALVTDNPFLADMQKRINYGLPLSPAQESATVAALARLEARQAANAALAHIGTVGARVTVAWTTDKVIQLEAGMYGTPYLYIAHDADGNKIKYIGQSNLPPTGETGTVVFTVREHSEYQNMKQTVAERPKWKDAPKWGE